MGKQRIQNRSEFRFFALYHTKAIVYAQGLRLGCKKGVERGGGEWGNEGNQGFGMEV